MIGTSWLETMRLESAQSDGGTVYCGTRNQMVHRCQVESAQGCSGGRNYLDNFSIRQHWWTVTQQGLKDQPQQ